jgi:putative endonuclease
MSRARAERQGRRGETLAAWWLRLHGWRIVARRQRVTAGEVDLIARRGGTLAFIEVKWRARAADLDTAIDAWRLRRVAAAASMIAPRLARANENLRIDVMLLAPWHRPRHLTNVWQP